MPCDDCPGEEFAMPRPARGARNYIVYTGEGYAAFYRLAASAIPEGELRHGRPVVLPGRVIGVSDRAGRHPRLRARRRKSATAPSGMAGVPVAYVERRSLLWAVGHPRHLYARQDGLRRQAGHDGQVPAMSCAAISRVT